MSFYGYENETQMFAILPKAVVSQLVLNAISKTIRACTRGELRCIGELGGKFLYADGTEDDGILLTLKTAEFNGDVYSWSVED